MAKGFRRRLKAYRCSASRRRRSCSAALAKSNRGPSKRRRHPLIVRDANGQALAYVYCEDELGRRSAAHLPHLRRGPTHRRQHRQAAGAVEQGGQTDHQQAEGLGDNAGGLFHVPFSRNGWRIRRDLPEASISLSLLPAYAALRSVCLRPSCFNVDPPRVGSVDAILHRHAVEYSTYPRGPRSGPGYSVPVRHHLIGPIRPTRGHIAISPFGLYAMPSLCGSA